MTLLNDQILGGINQSKLELYVQCWIIDAFLPPVNLDQTISGSSLKPFCISIAAGRILLELGGQAAGWASTGRKTAGWARWTGLPAWIRLFE